MRPRCGLIPTRCVHAAGTRIDPSPSEPRAPPTSPDAPPAADPPEDPPGVCSRLHGLRVTPELELSVIGHWPSSGVVVLPTMTAPATRSRRTDSESASLRSNSPAHPKAVG